MGTSPSAWTFWKSSRNPSRRGKAFMSQSMGAKRWAIPEGYIPPESHGPEPQMTSHETACLLNVSNDPAHVRVTI
ncbi:MAG: hypothetical protein KC584_07420, partial [Nitrospira sp.]|nr:hypothetical protein [Nitrospira sp.]